MPVAWPGHRSGRDIHARARTRPAAPVTTRAGVLVCLLVITGATHTVGEAEAAAVPEAWSTWPPRPGRAPAA